MPRRLPPLAAQFSKEASRAEDIAWRFELARTALMRSPGNQKLLHVANIELLYELAYLRVFVAWENFLEQSFLRYLCGYQHSGGQETIHAAAFYLNLAAAERAVLGSSRYVSWHNPGRVVDRAKRFFDKSRHELVLSSNLARLEYFAAVRHRIAHSENHAKSQFDRTTMVLCGKRYRGSRPGRFLRDKNTMQTPPERWLDTISQELSNLAMQIGG